MSIALILVITLYVLKSFAWKKAALLALLVLSLFLPQKAVEAHYASAMDMEFENSEPTLLWVAMGMQDGPRAPGWWNQYNCDTFADCAYDPQKASAVARADIADRLCHFASFPEEALVFYSHKIKTTWCEPTFQSIWSGPIITCGQNTYTQITRSIYENGVLYRLIYLVCDVLEVDILLFSLIWLTRQKSERLSVLTLLPVIYLMGGFLFHIFWETKSQYVYMYIFFLIPLAAKGAAMTQVQLEERLRRSKAT